MLSVLYTVARRPSVTRLNQSKTVEVRFPPEILMGSLLAGLQMRKVGCEGPEHLISIHVAQLNQVL